MVRILRQIRRCADAGSIRAAFSPQPGGYLRHAHAHLQWRGAPLSRCCPLDHPDRNGLSASNSSPDRIGKFGPAHRYSGGGSIRRRPYNHTTGGPSGEAVRRLSAATHGLKRPTSRIRHCLASSTELTRIVILAADATSATMQSAQQQIQGKRMERDEFRQRLRQQIDYSDARMAIACVDELTE